MSEEKCKEIANVDLKFICDCVHIYGGRTERAPKGNMLCVDKDDEYYELYDKISQIK